MTKTRKSKKDWATAAMYAGLAVWCAAIAASIYAAVRDRAMNKLAEEARVAAGVTNRIVTASWFGDNTLTEPRFLSDVLPTFTNCTGSSAYEASPWAFAYDWYIALSDAGSIPSGSYTETWLDVYRIRSGQGGAFKRLKVEAVNENRSIDDQLPPPEVTWSVFDPQEAAIWDESTQILEANGKSGNIIISATDTNDTTKTIGVNLVPMRADTVVKAYSGENTATERYIWSTNAFAKIAAVSTAAEDMVTIYGCRDATISGGGKGSWGSHYSLVPWSYPRALSRWGTGGRMYTNEWAGQSQPFEKAHRTWCRVENHDFFWPELQTNLWCYSINCHEAAGDRSNFDGKIATAIAPHYMITANHTCWMWGRTPSQAPRFRYGTGDNEVMACDYAGMKKLAVIHHVGGYDTDIALFRTTNTIPEQCIAHFADSTVLDELSGSGFSYVAGFTITTHQTVNPVCVTSADMGTSAWSTNEVTGKVFVGPPSGWSGSWSPIPLVGEERNPYSFDEADIPANVRNLEHMTHMQDSSDPVFLAAPNGRVVPCTQIHMAGFGNNGGGGPVYDDSVLEQIDSYIRADSGGTEGLRYWTKEDLWSGVGTRVIE